MRVWVDITVAADVVFFAPIVRRLESGGHTVTVTARRFASADALLHRYGLGAILLGRHKGGGVAARTMGLANRTGQLMTSASHGRYDVAAGTHTTDFVLAGWTLGIPQMTFLEEDSLQRATAVSMRLADEVAVPDAIAVDALARFRPAPRRFVRYPGFKEEYYLHDVNPDPAALQRLGVDARQVIGVVRPARHGVQSAGPGLSAGEAALAALVGEVAGRRNVTLVLLARDSEQRRRFLASAPKLVAPEGPVDGVDVLAAADFVLGETGVMLREAAALGTPAYTVSRRPPSAVDRSLLAAERLRPAATVDDLLLRKRPTRAAALEPRDPRIFVDELLDLARRRPRRPRAGGLAGGRGAVR